MAHAGVEREVVQLDPDHQPALAHLAHRRDRLDPPEQLLELLDLRLEVRDRRRQRQVAAREALRQAHQVGRDVLVLAGEHPPCSAEAGGDLVDDHEDVVSVTQFADRAQVALGVGEDPGGALHQRLYDDGHDLAFVLAQQILHVLGVAGLSGDRLEQQRAVGRVEEVDPADRHRTDRVAVVGVAERHELGPLRVLATALLPELERHLQRDLGRGRPRVRVEDAL
jgi:hypothetical protein